MPGRHTMSIEELGSGCFACLQSDGSWGWSNAGLISDSGASLLVDTLFTLPLTARMLRALRDACPSAGEVGQVVNTHANGDHCWGNQVVENAEIISTRKAAQEMREFEAGDMVRMCALARRASGWGRLRGPLAGLAGLLGATKVQHVLEAAPYLDSIFGDFDFQGIRLVPATRTFDGTLTLEVGSKRVELIEVGPAHTKGDLLVWLPRERILFTGDILFIDGHPIIWEGPVDNWIRACDRIVDLQPQAIVPGHGPLTDLRGVVQVRDYLIYLRDESTRRFEAGMGPSEAAYDISVGQFSHWNDAERVVVNVDTIYRDLRREPPRQGSPLPCFVAMSRYSDKKPV